MWSYKIVKNYYTTEEELDGYGADGWELVTVSHHRLYFKKWVEPEILIAVISTDVSDDSVVEQEVKYPIGPTGMLDSKVNDSANSNCYTGSTTMTGNTGPIVIPVPSVEPTAEIPSEVV